MSRAGASVINLSQGEPDFDSPRIAKEALWESLDRGDTNYSRAEGVPELREAIAEKSRRDNGIAVDSNNVIVTNGSYQAIFLAFMATVEPGDEVLLTDPAFGPYESLIRIAGGTPVRVPSAVERGRFSVPAEAWKDAVTSRTKALILNTPWNPTGTVLRRDELVWIARFAQEHDLWIIVDEIYERIVFDDFQHVSIASLSEDAKARTITVNGFSKAYAMTGWRLGYAVAASDVIMAMTRIHHVTARCATHFVQYAGRALLEGAPAEVTAMREEYQRRRNLVMELVRDLLPHATLIVPEGTFYALVETSAYEPHSDDLASHLLEDARVVVTPGSYFGACAEGHIRLSFASSEEDLREALDRLAKSLAMLYGP